MRFKREYIDYLNIQIYNYSFVYGQEDAAYYELYTITQNAFKQEFYIASDYTELETLQTIAAEYGSGIDGISGIICYIKECPQIGLMKNLSLQDKYGYTRQQCTVRI